MKIKKILWTVFIIPPICHAQITNAELEAAINSSAVVKSVIAEKGPFIGIKREIEVPVLTAEIKKEEKRALGQHLQKKKIADTEGRYAVEAADEK